MPKAAENQVSRNNEKELLDAIEKLNSILRSGIKANAYINKYGRNGLNDSLDEINRFKGKVIKK